MSRIKKITVFFLFSLLIVNVIFTLSACKKDGENSNGENGNDNDGDGILYVLSEETYKKNLKTGYAGFVTYIHTDGAVFGNINENKVYYAVVNIPGENFEKARFYLEGDYITDRSIIRTEGVYTSKYNKNIKGFDIERHNEVGNNYFCAAIKFEVSRNYSGGPIKIIFEYSEDAESLTYEKVAKKDVGITVLRGANTVSSVGYLTASDYMSGDYEDKIKDSIEVAIGEKCYVVIDYTLSNETKIEETDTATLKIYASSESALESELSVEVLPTADYKSEGNYIEATFKIHSSIDEGKKFRFIVSVSGSAGGEVQVSSDINSRGIFFIGGYGASGSVVINPDLKLESKLEFLLSNDGSYYTVIGLGKEYSDTVTIPSVHKDIPVKEIDSFVFMGANHIKKVILSEGLEKIGAGAFKNCMSLESVIIPSSVTEIGDDAFAGGNADICCIAVEKPDGWSETWTETDRAVTWNCSKLYTLNQDGKSYSFTLGSLDLTDVKILPKYNYLPVTAIADNAFASSVIKTVIIPEGIEVIGEKAFYGCTELTEISLPKSVKTIEKSAFEGCTALESVTLADDSELTEIWENAFKGCVSLTEITIPDNVETVGDNAFYGCTELKNVVFGADSKLKTVGQNAFADCIKLSSVTLPNNVETVGAYAFKGCIALETASLGEALKHLNGYTFDGCTLLSSVTLPSTLDIIYEYAFRGCTSLTEISIPDSVDTIGGYAFNGCTLLKNVNFGNSSTLKSIGEKAFENCVALTDFNFVGTLVSIDQYAFSGCTSLSSITIPKNLSSIGASAFYLCTGLSEVTFKNGVGYIGNAAFSGCSGIKTLVLPDSIRGIGDSAFLNCTGLTDVILPANLATISYSLFSGCTNLKSISIPVAAETVESEAFKDCKALESVTFIGSRVSKIGEKAFYNCVSLKKLTVTEKVTQISFNAFENCTGLTEIFFNAVSCADLSHNNFVFAKAGTAGEGITVTFGDQVKNIPAYLFYPYTSSSEYTPNIKNVIINSYIIENIGESAFYGTEYYNTEANYDSGVLYIGNYLIKAKDTLSGSYTVKDGTICIADYAFSGCNGLTYVTLPDRVRFVGDYAFNECTALEGVTFGTDIKKLCRYLFWHCTEMKEIKYRGTQKQWNAVSKESQWNYYNLSGTSYYQINCNYTYGYTGE